MNIILIPGFWLDGASWDEVADPLRDAGHTVTALTLPGLESVAADRSGIRLRDHVDAVTAAVDAVDPSAGPVVLVGHSGGGSIAWGAADARADTVSRVVFVASGPLGDGDSINDRLPVVGDEVPLPDWGFFDDADLADLHDELRERFRDAAIPEPARVTSDKQVLGDARRYDVPVSVISSELPTEQVRGMIESGHPYLAELGRCVDVELLDLPTGHWPQFTRPRDLADAILSAVVR